ncbi:MAG: hypothetical protein SOT81_01995 [Treponema sp.]|nr:hypothetical protein [Treponema sp.]
MKCFDTWSGVVTSAAGSLVTNSLNEAVVGARYESALGENGKMTTRLTQSKLDGFNSSQIESIQKLNGTIGGLASAGLSYGLTGEATFNILNITDFGAKAGSGLLEMTLSNGRGVTARLGTGGTDLSLGTVSSSLQGIKNLNKNMQIARAASRNNMGNAATALRTQYGFGDEKQLAQLEEILKGRTELKRGNGEGKAQTVTENGKRTVYLNSYKENMTREEQLALGITLGHEAYRDGITGGAQGQFNETAEAVLGHTALAKRMQSDSMYNYMMTGLINTDINLKNDMTAFDYALATGDWDAFGSYVGNSYDYSADYWRLKADGSIAFDGSRDLNVEYYDEWGSLRTKKGYIRDETGSMSQALAQYVGEERASQILGENWKNGKQYDSQTLKDVLELSDSEIEKVKKTGKLPRNITAAQKEKLIGEALMKNAGMGWENGKGWLNGENFKLKMTDDASIGQVIINKTENGYERFGITAEVLRDPLSYYSTRIQPNGKNSFQGLDYITYYKKDLNGNVSDSFTTDGWQTISNGYKTSYDPTGKTEKAYKPYEVYRDDSVATGSTFNMRVGGFKSPHYEGTIYVISDFTTMGGTYFGPASSTGGRTLVHSDFNYYYNESRKDGVSSYSKVSAACFVNSVKAINEMDKQLKSYGLPNYPYNIKGSISNKYLGRRQ